MYVLVLKYFYFLFMLLSITCPAVLLNTPICVIITPLNWQWFLSVCHGDFQLTVFFVGLLHKMTLDYFHQRAPFYQSVMQVSTRHLASTNSGTLLLHVSSLKLAHFQPTWFVYTYIYDVQCITRLYSFLYTVMDTFLFMVSLYTLWVWKITQANLMKGDMLFALNCFSGMKFGLASCSHWPQTLHLANTNLLGKEVGWDKTDVTEKAATIEASIHQSGGELQVGLCRYSSMLHVTLRRTEIKYKIYELVYLVYLSYTFHITSHTSFTVTKSKVAIAANCAYSVDQYFYQ